MFSSRNPDQLKDLVASAGPNAKAGTVADALAFGDVVLIVVPYTSMDQIAKGLRQAPRHQTAGDRRLQPDRAARGRRDFVKKVNEQGGAGLYAAKLLPGVPLVRGFNAIGYTGLAKAAHRSARRSACRSPATIPRRSPWQAR